MTQLTSNDPETARARRSNYLLLAALFQEEPKRALLERLRHADFQAQLAELGISFGPDFNTRELAGLEDELGIDYTRLFIGPGPHLSPHESIHVRTGQNSDGELYSPQTVKVKAFIEASGLHYDEQDRRLPDHLSTELEFMGRLAEFEASCRERGDDENAAGCIAIQKRFHEEHLLRWVPGYCKKLVEDASSPFYVGAARLLDEVIEYDYAVVRSSIVTPPTDEARNEAG